MNGGVILQLGGRYDCFERKVNRLKDKAKKIHFSPRLGLSVRVTPEFWLLGNWAETFRAPTPHETHMSGAINPYYYMIPNPNLKPETARETEIGFSWTRHGVWASGDTLETKLMLFSGRIKNLISLETIRPNEKPPASESYGQYLNADSVKRHGFEWTRAYRQAWGDVGLGYSRVRQTDRTTGKNVPSAFADKLNLHGHWQAAPGLLLGMNVNHWFKPRQNPESVVSRGRRLWYVRSAFTIVDMDARWQPRPGVGGPFGRDLEVTFGIRNVLNSRYINAARVESTGHVGKGRNIYLSVGTRF